MTEKKTTDARQRATNTYRQKNKKRTQYLNQKSAAKRFITANATDEDMVLVKEWLSEREGQQSISESQLNSYLSTLTEEQLYSIELKAKAIRLQLKAESDSQQLQEEKKTINSDLSMNLKQPE